MYYTWLFGLLGVAICSCAAASHIVAHRGDSSLAPENTLSSVKVAWEEDADAVEIDVYLTRDGRIMLMHDATTARTGDADLRLSETDSAELRKVDVGAKKSERFAGEKIPFLEEVLATVPPSKKLLIEVKCGPEILPVLKETVWKSGKASQVVIICFNLQVCAEAKKAMPSVPVCLLVGPTKDPESGETVGHDSAKWIKVAKSNRLNGLDMHFSGITPEFADAVKAAGLLLYAWTVNNADEAKRLKALGVTGITTDRPGWVMEQIGRG